MLRLQIKKIWQVYYILKFTLITLVIVDTTANPALYFVGQ